MNESLRKENSLIESQEVTESDQPQGLDVSKIMEEVKAQKQKIQELEDANDERCE